MKMFTFSFEDKIKFTKAVYYHFHKIPLPKPFKDGTGGMGKFAPEQGCIELYDQEGACAHLSVGPGFITDILPMILNGEEHSYNEWRNSLYWKIRNAGFQSEKAVEVGQLDLMMLDILAQRANKPLHRFMGATKDWAQAYKGGGSLLMEDDELVAAFLDMVENHKMIVENSGLLTVAALKHLDVSDKRIVSILSGGNMDVITMSSVVQQGLILRDRIFTVSVLLPDKPGELCKVSGIIAAQQGNVIKLEHNQFVTTNRSAAVELRITLECFGTDHKKQIIKALEKEGYKPKVVRTSL